MTEISANEPLKPATDTVAARLALAEQRARIALAAAAAMFVAGVVLMTAILPAEYCEHLHPSSARSIHRSLTNNH